MEEALLILVATPALEEPLVDWLLEREDVPAFTSMPISGHGVGPATLSIAEQVTGRQHQVMLHVQTPLQEADALIAELRGRFAGTGLSYWVMPLIEMGRSE